jgi:hypothetical protein
MHKSFIAGGLTGAGIVLAVAGLLAVAYHNEFSEAAACGSTVKAMTSPSRLYRADMTNQICRWGLGFAATNVTVKVEKLGKGGWFYTIPLEYDDPNGDNTVPPPTIKWTGPNSLLIVVPSHDTAGTLFRTSKELTVTRSYGLPGR